MGMAASQARYLALVARKSNCEYEGQQINQARLILSNQSANLFNQMLGLSVPVPPSTQDFTKIQYSYTDGVNCSTIDSWKQLSNDPEYNYVVKRHYYTDVYTGSVKKLTDPQVQVSSPNGVSTSLGNWFQIEAAYNALTAAENVRNSAYDTWQATKSSQERNIANIKREAQGNNDYQVFQQALNQKIASTIGTGYTNYLFSAMNATVPADSYHYDIKVYDDPDSLVAGSADETAARSVLQGVKDMIDLGIMTLDEVNAAILQNNEAWNLANPTLPQRSTTYISNLDDLIDYTNVPPYSDIQREVLQTFALSVELQGATAGTAVATGNTEIVLNRDVLSLDTDLPTTAGTVNYAFGGYPLAQAGATLVPPTATNNTTYLSQITAAQALIDADYSTYEAAETIYQNARAAYDVLNRPTYIGNSALKLLGTLTEDQSTELLQVVKDMKAQDISSHLLDCFADDGSYLGGVYTFQLNGNTYYTTFEDLSDAYASNHLSNNLIDAQYKMPYYNASYISTRIDQEGKALLETDGEGRFSSIRFENDSVKYVLKTETITDDDAYQDAMNQYYYENAIYDKTVQDINAQTSIIQQEDQQLELRLKQLDTEQNALKTEMEAVQKIVKDNVDASFKTFGG